MGIKKKSKNCINQALISFFFKMRKTSFQVCSMTCDYDQKNKSYGLQFIQITKVAALLCRA